MDVYIILLIIYNLLYSILDIQTPLQYTYTREHTIEYWPMYRCLAKLLEQLRMPTKSYM